MDVLTKEECETLGVKYLENWAYQIARKGQREFRRLFIDYMIEYRGQIAPRYMVWALGCSAGTAKTEIEWYKQHGAYPLEWKGSGATQRYEVRK